MRTLEDIAMLLGDTREPWWVIGSAAVALHGVRGAGRIGDVDVLLGIGDARRIVERLALDVGPADSGALFRSTVFAQWHEPALRVELMAGLQVFSEDKWTSVEPQSREIVTCDDVFVPVPSRAELRGILTRFGRPKDLLRAASLLQL